MDELAELVRAVRRADPMDLSSRRVVADYLLAHGDAERGEWIQVACDCNSLPESPERARLLERWRVLWQRNSSRWWKHFHAWGLNIHHPNQYACGLVESIHVTTRDLLAHREPMFASEPIVGVWLDVPDAEQTRALVSWPLLGELRMLSFGQGGPPGTGVEVALAAPQLEGLCLQSGLAGEHTRMLATSSLRPEHLRLGAGPATEHELATLLAAPFGSRIVELWVAGAGWHDAVLDAVARPLRKLWLFGCTITPDALARVIDALTVNLFLSRTAITTEHIERIVAGAPKLSSLALHQANLGDGELRALIDAKLPLALLDVADNRLISSETALALASAYPRTELDFRGCGLDEDAIEELKQRPGPVVRTQRVEDMPPGWYGRLP